MQILNKLVKQNLIKNKQRTIVSIVGIILSCALITALFGLVVSFQETLIEQSLINSGNRHVTFKNVEQEDIKKISEHKEVNSYFLTFTQVAKDIDNSYIGINNLDKKGLEELKNQLIEGNTPTNENEIAIDYYYADKNNIDINDEITVNVGNRLINNEIITETSEVFEDEEFQVTETKTYKVVGITHYYTYLSSIYGNDFYIYNDNINTSANMHILYNNPKNYDEITSSINGTKKDTDSGKYTIEYNSEYLRWAGYAVADNTKIALYIIVGTILFIIIFTSVFCIRNSFAISVSEKTRLYGMLSSIGATPKQIKQNVLKEGFYLGMIGIPIGILSGILTALVLISIVNYYLPKLQENFNFIFKISIESIILAIILSIVTIYLSAISSAKKASKITEIEAIKNQKEIKLNNKKLKTPKVIEKYFKIGGVFAYKNMKRNKSKYRTTIISLVVSITTFIAISYFMQMGFSTTETIFEEYSFNMSVTLNHRPESNDQYQEEKIYKDIYSLNNIESFALYNSKQLLLDDKYLDKKIVAQDSYYDYAKIISVNEEEYTRFLKEADLEYNDVKNKGILVYNSFPATNAEKEVYYQNIINEELNKISFIDQENHTFDIQIIKAEADLMGLEDTYDTSPIILVSKEYFDTINVNAYYENLYINSSNPRELQNQIYDYEEKEDVSFYMFNIEEYIEMQNNLNLLMAIFLYGFILIITLIGFTNIFNTITTNMLLRAREFAILKSIGMTSKEFKNMIRLESIFYGVKSLFFGLLFGLSLSYLIYLGFKEADMLTEEIISKFIPPYTAILIAIIFVFLIINLIMKYSLSKINKQNIIETIKKENI